MSETSVADVISKVPQGDVPPPRFIPGAPGAGETPRPADSPVQPRSSVAGAPIAEARTPLTAAEQADQIHDVISQVPDTGQRPNPRFIPTGSAEPTVEGETLQGSGGQQFPLEPTGLSLAQRAWRRLTGKKQST